MRQIFLAVMFVSFSVTSWAQTQKSVSPKVQNLSLLLKVESSRLQFTSESPVLLDYKKSLKDPQRPQSKDRKMYRAEGGVSDGGGNAVGAEFFDFYENKGTIRLSPLAALMWNRTTLKAFERMNALVPAVMDLDGKGFGEVIEAAIATKIWYLEPKPLDEQSCRNNSFIYVVDRIVVGCQNDFEVRLNAQWLLNRADEENQAGLIVHEALLAWARGYDDEKVKENLEYKVRDVNRLVFEGASSQELVAQLNKHYRMLNALEAHEGSLLKQLPQIRKQSVMEMCAGRALSHESAIQQLNNTPKLKAEVELALDFVGKYSNTASLNREMFCAAENPENVNLANAQVLTESCRKRTDHLFRHYQSIQDLRRRGGLKIFEVLAYGATVEKTVDQLVNDGCGLSAAQYFGTLKNQYEK